MMFVFADVVRFHTTSTQ